MRRGYLEMAEDLLIGLATVLGISRSEIIDSQWVDNGPGWVGGSTVTCVRGEVEL